MRIDENTDTGDPVQPVNFWINPTTIDPVAAAVQGRLGKHRQPKLPQASTGYPTLRVANSTMEIDNHRHKRAEMPPPTLTPPPLKIQYN
jgi:hypothetical protein